MKKYDGFRKIRIDFQLTETDKGRATEYFV